MHYVRYKDVTWTIAGEFVPGRIRTQENSYPGEFVPKMIRYAFSGSFVPGYELSREFVPYIYLLF